MQTTAVCSLKAIHEKRDNTTNNDADTAANRILEASESDSLDSTPRTTIPMHPTKPPTTKANMKSPVVDVKTTDGVKYTAADGSWLMLRGSGTEPILRIYAETDSDIKAQALLKLGVKLTSQVA